MISDFLTFSLAWRLTLYLLIVNFIKLKVFIVIDNFRNCKQNYFSVFYHVPSKFKMHACFKQFQNFKM